MTASTPAPQPPAPARNPGRVSLRLRLWLACLAGGTVAGLGVLWVFGTRVRPGAADPAELFSWMSAVAFAAVLTGLFFAIWLDHHVVGHLRGLLRGLRADRVAELRGLPASAGWGELSDLTNAVADLLGHQRRAARSVAEMEQVRTHLGRLHQAIERWGREEAWESPVLPAGPVEDLNDALARGLARRTVVEEQNREVAGQIARELSGALADAQESATQAERGFVEATAMLTTVRELQRLTSELQNVLDAIGTPASPAVPEAPAATREVLGDLVTASHESVESLGRGLGRVQDVAEQVQQLANRSTLIAIHVVTGLRHEPGDSEIADELKRLARDVREATERASQFALEVETAVAAATARMREARERAIKRLEAAAAAAPAATGGRALDDAQRLLERVREMVQDAARKGERLSQAGERASRAAERLVRRVDEEAAESEALAVRLSSPGAAAADDPPAPAVELRLLDEAAPAEPEAPARPKEERP